MTEKDYNPLISIIIPTFNRERLIDKTLDSVIIQTYLNWECIIVDDGSSDNSHAIIDKYQKKDNRFHLTKRNREPKGASTCRNIGANMASGEYIIFLDSDDVLDISCLENRVNKVQKYPDNDFWVFKTAQFNAIPGDSKAIWNLLHKEIDDLQRFILQDPPWHTTGPIWRKETVLSLGGFNEKAICWQDWEIHIRSLTKGIKYWKDNDEIIDSYYRNDKTNKNDTISGQQNQLNHILYRIELFQSIYNDVTLVDNRKEIKDAFAVLFFRLFKELYPHRKYHELRNLFGILMKIKVFTSIELLLLRLICFPIENKNNERRKFKYSILLLNRINPQKFNNKVNSTFQN